MPTSDAYNHALIGASVKLKVVAALLLSATFALLAAGALKAFDSFDRAISTRIAANSVNGN